MDWMLVLFGITGVARNLVRYGNKRPFSCSRGSSKAADRFGRKILGEIC